ncbi:serine/threonine-protein kinase Sgk2-like isoform X2 [Artemia franciscana]|uniref:Uncharacterized protein n=2 Tax=Artemia franciscana TaxID=6661 RepID=A0AA88H7K6_ARTSF|nr:hypothetical protein QYM36_017223 [Artemia franciscana]
MPGIFSSGHIRVSVVDQTTEHQGAAKSYTAYHIQVSLNGRIWTVKRRYSEFSQLYLVIKTQCPHLSFRLPGKRLFGSNFDPLFLRSRKDGLSHFLQKLVADPSLVKMSKVQAFLRLTDENSNKSFNSTGSSCESHEDSSSSSNSSVESENTTRVNMGPKERHVSPWDFEFLCVVGKGSFGKVLLAKHIHDKQHYAIKVLEKEKIIKRNETRHILAERNILLKNISHPFLVSLKFCFQTKDKLYFALDFINGGELFFHIRQERTFSDARVRFYAAEISLAIGHLHSRGVVYRDLKPENILLDRSGHVVLTDFGLCKEILGEETTGTFCGTPEYLAPEVIRKEPYNRAVDWWCLGTVLYELLSGLPPFYSKHHPQMYHDILYKPLKLKSSWPEATRSFLSGLLEKDCQDRLGSGPTDVEEVKAHCFFEGLNWDDVLNKRYTPPYIPQVKDCMDLSCIDSEFTKSSISDSIRRCDTASTCSSISDLAFQGFSYVPQPEITS